ncbi:unnamed protein product [Natator depressus]
MVAESPSEHQRLVLAEVSRIRDLLDYDRGDWVDPYAFGWCMGLSTLGIPWHILREVETALLPTSRSFLKRVLHEIILHPPLTPGPPYLFTWHLPPPSTSCRG